MALVLKDRVKETSTTTGTGTFTLAGAATGFQSFSVIGNSNTVYYAIVRNGYDEWEIGIGTYTSSGTTLSRDTVLESSNSGSKVNFSAGTKEVFCTYPAEKSVTLDDVQTLSNKTLASPSVTGEITFNDASTQNTAATGFGFKNRLLNGSMMIDQRNAGASQSITSGTSPYTLDRFVAYNNGTNTFTTQQSSTAPSGFSNSLVITNGTATSNTASMYQLLGQRIEAYNFNDFAWGTASAKALTVSFWVYTSQTGTYSFVLRNGANTRFYPQSFSVASANTWTQITQTVAGDTSGTWAGTNGTGLEILFCLSCGSAYVGTSGAWSGTQALGVTGQTQFNATGSATFYITGVQLEKGSTATSFDYRPYGTELALCQRYYETLFGYVPITTGTEVGGVIYYKVDKRASGTVTLTRVAGTNANSPSTFTPSTNSVGWYVGGNGWIQISGTANSEL